jgi:hypothetical protein
VCFVELYLNIKFECAPVSCEKGVLYNKAYEDTHGVVLFLVVVSAVYSFTVSTRCPLLPLSFTANKI